MIKAGMRKKLDKVIVRLRAEEQSARDNLTLAENALDVAQREHETAMNRLAQVFAWLGMYGFKSDREAA